MLRVLVNDLHTPKLQRIKGGNVTMGGGGKSGRSLQGTFLYPRQYPADDNSLTLSLWASCSAAFSAFPWAEVQRRGADSEDQRGGRLGAGEEVLGADGEHAPQEGRSR